MKFKYIFKIFAILASLLLAACSEILLGDSTADGYYTISFDSQGGTNCPPQTVTLGSTIILPAANRSGYIFEGWFSANYGGVYYGLGGDAYTVNLSRTLYAHWGGEIGGDYRTVFFNSQGGTICSDKTVTLGSTITLPFTNRSGYIFEGWFSANYGGVYYGLGGDAYTVNSDKTLYAHWIWCTSPSVPTGVSAAAISSNSVKISWNAVAGADYYEVYWSENPTGYYEWFGYAYSTSYIDDDQYNLPSTTYYYKVKAVNDCGESGFSNYAYATTMGGGYGTLVINNASYDYDIVGVYIENIVTEDYIDDWNNWSAIIQRNGGKSYQLPQGGWDVEVYDDYGDGYYAQVNISRGQTKTLTYDGYSLR
ncbi:MAG: InlB B-repeat-containing protein [Chitinispirillales bacterium]|jgi:hypothetical protein|nr:InlB B-repeat-containing protein [Chitinispirillales bacterium]